MLCSWFFVVVVIGIWPVRYGLLRLVCCSPAFYRWSLNARQRFFREVWKYDTHFVFSSNMEIVTAAFRSLALVCVFALNVFERFGSVQRQTFAVELFVDVVVAVVVIVVVVTLLCNTHFTSSVRRHRICALSSFV